MPLLRIETRLHSHPSHSTVTVLTELTWFLDTTQWLLLYIGLTVCFVVGSLCECSSELFRSSVLVIKFVRVL
jgi:hypothetical protein